MAHKMWIFAIGASVAAAPLLANPMMAGPSPNDGPGTRYCLRIAPATGSLAETVRCWTRDQWADQGVDVDKEWAKEGVAVRN